MGADPSPRWFVARPLLWAVPVAAVIALAGTADMIFREDVRLLYETNPDILSILDSAEQATSGDVVGWWTGVWIERDSPYYRPLASMLIYGEYLAFGRAWRPFCIVSWLMHAGLCVLMLLFLGRLFGHWPAHLRVLPGLIAVAWFSIPCETTVDGPHWGNRGIARGLMPYWPAQTDLGCLLLSLLSLLLWDRWLANKGTPYSFHVDEVGQPEGSQREMSMVSPYLLGAIAAFVAALLFKEHAVILPLIAAAVALYRKRPWKLVGASAAIGLGVSGLFLVLRSLLAPEAWGPQFKGVGHVFVKAVMYLCEPALIAEHHGYSWLIISAVLLAACVGLALYFPRRLYLHAFGALFAILLPAHFLAGNMAQATVQPFAGLLARLTLTLVLLILLWEQRARGPAPLLAACLLIVHLPVLHVTGPHYYYWPVAWWSMLNAAVIVGLGGTWRAAMERARSVAKAPSSPDEDSLPPRPS